MIKLSQILAEIKVDGKKSYQLAYAKYIKKLSFINNNAEYYVLIIDGKYIITSIGTNTILTPRLDWVITEYLPDEQFQDFIDKKKQAYLNKNYISFLKNDIQEIKIKGNNARPTPEQVLELWVKWFHHLPYVVLPGGINVNQYVAETQIFKDWSIAIDPYSKPRFYSSQWLGGLPKHKIKQYYDELNQIDQKYSVNEIKIQGNKATPDMVFHLYTKVIMNDNYYHTNFCQDMEMELSLGESIIKWLSDKPQQKLNQYYNELNNLSS